MEKKPFEEGDFYVTDPTSTKDGVSSYTSYTVKGKKITDPVIRRYREFDCLRTKLFERWPGIFIPELPHKKAVGKNDKEVVDFRIEQINRFCVKLSNIPYLFNSNETQMFLQNTSDVIKTMNNLQNESYEDMLNKYQQAFPDFDENFDAETAKSSQDKFYEKIKSFIPKANDFRALVKDLKAKSKKYSENFNKTIDMFNIFEKDILMEYANNDGKQLVFFNLNNNDLCQRISEYQDNAINPYDSLYDKLTEEILDLEGMVDAFESLKELREKLTKMNKNIAKNPNNATENEKNNRDSLETLIRICGWNLENEVKKFKNTNLSSYYAELWKLKNNFKTNTTLMDNMFDEVLRDKNVSENKVNS